MSRTGNSSDSRHARLAGAVSGLMREMVGRGPERTRVYIEEEHVFVVMEGGLTPLEETLLDAGEDSLVREIRVRFDEQLGGRRLAEAVEEVLGCRVLDFSSQLLIPSRRFVEVFVIAPTG